MTTRTRLWVALVVASLIMSACVDDFSSDLGGTEWVIVSMAGFPQDNIVEGSFDFTNDRIRFHDGVNFSSRLIDWPEEGFTVEGGGDTTDVGVEDGDPQRYLTMFLSVDSSIGVAEDEQGRLTLSRNDGLTLTAEPGQ